MATYHTLIPHHTGRAGEEAKQCQNSLANVQKKLASISRSNQQGLTPEEIAELRKGIQEGFPEEYYQIKPVEIMQSILGIIISIGVVALLVL